jgi:hypothetical protein
MGLLVSSSSAYRLLAAPLYLVGARIVNSRAFLPTPPLRVGVRLLLFKLNFLCRCFVMALY